MTKQPLISVVMPAYNHEQFVQQAIRSVIQQDYANVELLVTNDGSTDSTWDKINELKAECEKRFVRVVFATQPNRGTCQTFNELVGKAQGQFVAVLASDDELLPGALTILGTFLDTHPDYALAVGDNHFILPEGTRLGRSYSTSQFVALDDNPDTAPSFGSWLQKRNPTINFESDQFGSYRSLLAENYIPNGYLIRKEMLEKTGGWTPQAPLEDWYIMLQLAKLGKFKYFKQPLFGYRIHSTNTIFNFRRMEEMKMRTILYEARQVLGQGPAEHKADLSEELLCFKRAWQFGFGQWLGAFKQKNYFFSQAGVSIFGKQLIVRNRARPGSLKNWEKDPFLRILSGK